MAEGNNSWSVVIGITILFVILIVLGVLTKNKVINEYAGMAMFILVFFVIFMWVLLAFIAAIRGRKTEDKATDTLDYYMREINKVLLARPGGDAITWEGGKDIRYEEKVFNDANHVPNEFIAVVGTLKNSLKRVIVIYNIKKRNIAKFYGDPSPDLINNPFYEFDPFGTRSSMGFGGFYGDRFNPYDRNRGNINVNLGRGGNDNSGGNSGGSLGGLENL